MIWGPANVFDLFESYVAGPQRVQKLKRVKHHTTQAYVHLHVDLIHLAKVQKHMREAGGTGDRNRHSEF